MNEKILKKLELAGEKLVDYVLDHPIKTLIIGYVLITVTKWFKEQ